MFLCKHHIEITMRKRVYVRIVAGLLCGALLFTDAASIGVQASSYDTDAGQTEALTASIDEDETNDTTVVDEEKEDKSEEKVGEETSPAEKSEEDTTGSETTEEGETEDSDGKEEKPEDQTKEETLPKEDQPKEEIPEGKETEEQEDVEKPGQTEDEPEGETTPIEEENEEQISEDEPVESVSENTTEDDVIGDENLEADAVVMAAAGDIASGEIDEDYGHMTWVITEKGKLVVKGTGNYRENPYAESAPWLQYSNSITSATIEITGITSTRHMFLNCKKMISVDLSRLDTSKVIDMGGMFSGCYSLNSLDLSHMDTSEVKDMSEMFYECQKLTSLDLSSWNTKNLKNMSSMFYECYYLESIDLVSFNVSKVTNMYMTFYRCYKLKNIDLSKWNASNVKTMRVMFYENGSLENIDLSGFDVAGTTDMTAMFNYCTKLSTIYTPRNVKLSVLLPQKSENTKYDDTPYVWYRSDGTVVTELPQNLNYSVALGKNYIPTEKAPDNPPEEDDLEEEYISTKEKYVRNVTQYSLVNASDDEKKKVWDGLYDVMFNAYYRPIGYDPDKVVFFGGSKDFIVNWKPQNNDSDDSTITDKNLGEITYENSARGCLSYAHFVSKYVHGKNGERSNKKYRCWVSGDTKEKLEESQKAIENLIHTYADPGETIGFFIEGGKCIHYVVYLGETKDGSGFDCISYGGGRLEDENGNLIVEDHTIVVERYTYKGLADKFVKQNGANRFIVWDTNDGLLRGQTDTKIENPAATKIQVACPVEAIVELNGEKLDSRALGTSSFGSVSRDGEQITFDITYSPNYSLQILGTGEGAMTVTLTYYDGTGKQINQRKFVNIPVTASTEVESGGFNHIADFVLYVSEKDKELSAWGAGPGETVYAPNDDFLPDSSFEYVGDDESSVHYKDIPDSGEIPQGLWISAIPDYTYTGTAIKPEVRVYDGEKRLKRNKDYTISYKNNTKAAQSGDAKPPTVVVKGKGNYSGTETQTFNITKRDIADDCVIKTFTDAYMPLTNGKNPKLVFSAKCNKKTLKKNTDYTLTVKDASGNETESYAAEGTYSVVIKGAGTNYMGESVLTFEVLNKVPVSKLKVNKIAAVEFDGTSKRPQPVIKYGKVTLRKGTDYSLYYRNNREMGTATIQITGKGEYFGTRNVTFAITGRQIKKAKFAGFMKSFPYTGDTIYQSETVLKYGEDELMLGTDYTVSYDNHLNKGKATITYIGLGNYTGTLKKTYNISAYNITTDAENRISISTDEITAVYEKGGAKPSLKVYDGMRLLTEGKDYTLSYQNNTAITTQTTVKQPTITVKGKGNYTGIFAQKKPFTIVPKAFTEITMTANDVAASPKVGKYKSVPVLTDVNGKKLTAGTDYEKTYTYTYKNKTENVWNAEVEVTRNAGDLVETDDIVPVNTVLCVSVRAKEGGNYTGEKTAEYRIVSSPISKAKVIVQNPAQNQKNLFLYTGQEIRIDKSNLIVKVGEDILKDNQYEILEDTYKNNINKGTASVQIRGAGDIYGGIKTVKFRIGSKGFQWFWRLFG